MSETTEPILAPPGAGLPKVELFVARAMFKWRRLMGNRKSFDADFECERAAIRVLVQSCSGEAASKRVLIKRIPGLEDSSRYWSVWMTLEHLRIVNSGVARTIAALAKGKQLPGAASTAAVKPSPDVTSAVVDEYEKACEKLVETVADITDLRTKLCYTHPWFGSLDAAGWHSMAGSHMTIHRKQIERILKR
jgi:hypothetical protein